MSGGRGHLCSDRQDIGRQQQVDNLRTQPHDEREWGAAALVVAAVRAALHQNRLLFAFQPVVCAATGKVDYFECLLRMRDEAGGIVAGCEFITVVEELGWIGPIDRFVLQKTIQELAADPEVRLGFNVSGLTTVDRPWLRASISLLRSRPELARRLVVEITETAALCDLDASARFVDTLRHTGCRVAIDDFGAGHTSLQQLQCLAVDTVKIDGSFVRNLTTRSEDRAFLRHLLELTKNFGLSTVAECVESAEEAAILRAEGIGYFQGYHFGRPTIERAWLSPPAPAERPTP